LGDVLGVPKPSQHTLLPRPVQDFRGNLLGELRRADVPRSNRVYIDVLWAQLDGRASCEPNDAGLGGDIVGQLEFSSNPVDRGHLYDLPPLLAPKDRGNGSDKIERAVQVGFQNGVPIFIGHPPKGPVPSNPGIVDQEMKAAQLLHGIPHERLNLLGVSHITGAVVNPDIHVPQLCGHLVGRPLGFRSGIQVVESHMDSRFRERQGHGSPDAGGCACDQGDSTPQATRYTCRSGLGFGSYCTQKLFHCRPGTLARAMSPEVVRWFGSEIRRRIWLFGHATGYLTNARSRNGKMNSALGTPPVPQRFWIVLDGVVTSIAMNHSMEGQSPQVHGAFSFSHPGVEEAWAFLQSIDAWVLDRQIELTAIPAPPFQERARGNRMAELFLELGLGNVRIDEVGNVLGEFSEENHLESEAVSAGDPLILSAHLDTVFPPGTDVTPHWDGDRVRAPGISDDGRGLAALLALIRVLSEVNLPLSAPLLFVATVGEEGPGDLRGVRHLFPEADREAKPRGFISLDGAGLDRIINRGVGSTRLRIKLTGPGGHSWTDFDRPNPIHILGRIVAKAQTLALSSDPKSTLTVARWGGGTSINSIPQEAWVEVDMRGEAGPQLEALEGDLVRVCEEEVGGRTDSELGQKKLGLQVQEIGRRPAGSTEPSEPLVRAALEATRLLGGEPTLISSSTDANVPMSLGIPAITLGAGGVGGGIHTAEEWYQNRKGPEGILRALLAVLLFGEMA